MAQFALKDQRTDVANRTLARQNAARACQRCGAPARVHILVGYEDGKPKLNEFCFDCAAEHTPRRESAQPESRERIRMASVSLFFGAALAIAGTSGAVFGISGSEGFGWYQRLGVSVGVLVAICGGLLRIELLALAGAIVVGLSAGIDFVATERSHAGGWLSYATSCVGLMFLVAGLMAGRRASGRGLKGKATCND